MENSGNQKLKVLCLHGHYNTGEVMKHQLAYYEYIFRDYVQFEYLTAPHKCEEVFDPKLHEKFGEDFYTWIIHDTETNESKGFNESFISIKEHLDTHGPYDGILGFSLGGYFTRILLKSNEIGFPVPKNMPKFAVIFSSIIYPNSPFAPLREEYEGPMMYIYGNKDKVFPNYDGSHINKGEHTIIEHEQGHNIPKFVGEDMQSFTRFFNSAYEKKFGRPMEFDFEVNEQFKQAFNEQQKQKMPSKQIMGKL